MATCDWGADGQYGLEGAVGRPYGCDRVYGEAIPTFQASGWDKNLTGGNYAAGSAMQRCIDNDRFIFLSIFSATTKGPAEDAWSDSSFSTSGKTVMPAGPTGDPAQLFTPSSSNRESDIDDVADRLANFMRRSHAANSQGGFVFCLDHESDLRMDENPHTYNGALVNKGPASSFPAGFAHWIYRTKARWATLLSNGSISQAVYDKLTGATLRTDGKKFARFAPCWANAGFNLRYLVPNAWTFGLTNLADYCDIVAIDLYCESPDRGFKEYAPASSRYDVAPGPKAPMSFQRSYEGDYVLGSVTAAQHKAKSAHAMMQLAGVPYQIWEWGCQRQVGAGAPNDGDDGSWSGQADWTLEMMQYLLSQGTATEHCDGMTYFHPDDGNSFGWGFPWSTDSGWSALSSFAQETFGVMNAMANHVYFGGSTTTTSVKQGWGIF